MQTVAEAPRGAKTKVELIWITPDAQRQIEAAGRTCRLTLSGDNTAGPFVRRMIGMGHGAMLEHASASFRLSNVSRALTHQLVRHRLASFAQQSQRHVNEDGFSFIIPHTIESNSKALEVFLRTMQNIQDAYEELRSIKDYDGLPVVPKEDARYVLPNACTSEIVLTANMREWRTIFDLRCDVHAQWEIREVCEEILALLTKECPDVFYDLAGKYLGESK